MDAQTVGEGPVAEKAAGIAAPAQADGGDLVLDLSYPLCPRRCDYCAYRPLPAMARAREAYVAAMRAEIAAAAPDFADRRLVAVRLGGGMPGALSGSQLHGLLRAIRDGFACAPQVELTVELTPDYTTSDFLTSVDAAFRLRPSFGFVSAHTQELSALGAWHDYGSFQDLKELLVCRRITDFSLDVLVGVFGQTERSLAYSLHQAIALGAPHITLLPFRLDPTSRCAQRVEAGELAAPGTDEDPYPARLTRLYAHGAAVLREEGYLPYAAGSFALPGHESAYTQAVLAGAGLLGVGLCARSRFDDMELLNTADFKAYTADPANPAATCACSRILDEGGMAANGLGLRLRRACDAGDATRPANVPTELASVADELVDAGLARWAGGVDGSPAGDPALVLTDAGAADYERRVLPVLGRRSPTLSLMPDRMAQIDALPL